METYVEKDLDFLHRIARALEILHSTDEYEFTITTSTEQEKYPFCKKGLKRILFGYYLECRERGLTDEFNDMLNVYKQKEKKEE